jgi:hypothetical protein
MCLASITLEQAQRRYGCQVPWVLDSDDLSIINRTRNEYHKASPTGCLLYPIYGVLLETAICQRLWIKATN